MNTRSLPISLDFAGHGVRVVSDDPFNPVFVAKDVAEALGYKNVNKAINDHCKGVTKRYPLETLGGMQPVNVINEADMYRLIFGSKLKSAVKFQDWVFEVVLPAVRQSVDLNSVKSSAPVHVLPDPRDKYISPAQQSHIQKAVSDLVKSSRGFISFQAVWRKLNQSMGVASYRDILKVDYSGACKALGVRPKTELIEAVKFVEHQDKAVVLVDEAFCRRAMNNIQASVEQMNLAMGIHHGFLRK